MFEAWQQLRFNDLPYRIAAYIAHIRRLLQFSRAATIDP